MIRSQDALELLLPDADAAEARRARNVTHFLRLLSNDAQPARARTVGVDLDRARHELERADRADLERALSDLVRHHLAAVQSPDSFAWCGEPEFDLRAAWRTVADFSADQEWLASVPGPGETPESVVERLLASLERLGIPSRRLALWRARAAHVVEGARAAEPLFRAELRLALSETASIQVVDSSPVAKQGNAPGRTSARGPAAHKSARSHVVPGTSAQSSAGLNHAARPSGAPIHPQPEYGARIQLAPEGGARVQLAPECGAQIKLAPEYGASGGLTRSLIAGVAECMLDRGAVREARAWLYEHLALAGGDARLRQLLAWSRLGLGDVAGAKAVLLGSRPWPGALPAGLADLRASKPEWLPCLAGRTLEMRRARAETSAPRDRQELGATVLAIFVFRPGQGAEPLHAHVAPGLQNELDAWLHERQDACVIPGQREHRLVVGARTIVEHAEASGAGASANVLRAALGREATRALAQAPVLDDDGEVAGWLHIECEHHLLPSRARLSELACAWRTEILARRAAPAAVLTSETTSRNEPDAETLPCAAAFGDLVADLAIKTHQRLWWGFVLGPGACASEPELVARGGEGVGLATESAGKRRGLQRALASSGHVQFDDPDERLALRADAGSGFVLPLAVEGRICGLLAVESSRRRDFRSKDVEAAAATAERHALALRLAQFRAWHLARFGFEPWFDAMRPDFRTFARSLVLGARSRSPLVIAGPAGAGKLVFARWFHFESDRRDGPFKVLSCAATRHDSLEPAFEAAAGGSLVLDDVEDLAAEQQEALLRRLEGIERALDRPNTRRDGAARRRDPDEAVEAQAVDDATVHGARGARPGVDGSIVRAERVARCHRDARAVALDRRSPRVLCTTRLGLAAARESGKLRADLAARLDRLALFVPALRERREEIPELVHHLARRFAREEATNAPRFEDDALALLWRQAWPGNLRDLENVVYKLVLMHPGRAVSAVEVRDLRRLFGVDLVKRLPSRHPDRRDIVSALRTTQKPGGRANKTRAALYLGWDPDTLVARMQAENVPEAGFDLAGARESECAWKCADAEESGLRLTAGAPTDAESDGGPSSDASSGTNGTPD